MANKTKSNLVDLKPKNAKLTEEELKVYTETFVETLLTNCQMQSWWFRVHRSAMQ